MFYVGLGQSLLDVNSILAWPFYMLCTRARLLFFFRKSWWGLKNSEWEGPGMFYVVHSSGKAAAMMATFLKTGHHWRQKKAAQVYLTQAETAALVRLHWWLSNGRPSLCLHTAWRICVGFICMCFLPVLWCGCMQHTRIPKIICSGLCNDSDRKDSCDSFMVPMRRFLIHSELSVDK